MNNTVIVLGYREGIANVLIRQGYQVIHIVSRFKPALSGTEYYMVKDLEDAQEVLRCLLNLPIQTIKGIVTGNEDGVFTATVLRDMLQLPGPKDYRSALYFRDKCLQKQRLAQVVPHAHCRYVTRDVDYSQLVVEVGSPFIIKPANGMGSFATTAIGSEFDYETYFRQGKENLSCVAYVVENKITASEFIVDGIWSDSKLRWLSICQYTTPPMQCNEGKTLALQIMSRKDFAEFYEQINAFCLRALTQLQAPDGVFHLELFKNDAGIFFNECALRPAGAWVPEIITLSYGVDLYAAHTLLSLEQPDEQPLPHYPSQLFAIVLLRAIPGVSLTRQDFYQNFDLVELDWTEGEQAESKGIYGRAGYAIIKHEHHQTLMENVNKLIAFTEHKNA
ncbi:ATP-grasp domain-containing protein [Xenorhabdus cabanillasii]|uniref:Similarities with NikS protein involved in antibiotic nikkomycin biosynthesis n=1 Tax=Xenorhabdus cabanillasii JM26 TaxID=1427517 RepID=W1IR57_9GAMM|nr:ATP-grasp domain-containing protein [Xenorhabdus cabanillasii]PHM75495.1 HsvC-like protein [Xenorhabdus cabanillasii JM26]CDL80328.1 Similarities with NikS protein involved in antibiotic nikkomycin biosynthesis [Xenorhabdus cabanillasii JM26]